ncbi:Tyrosine-sulfated glycopeptide receptor 1 [Morella rubra]|uniref:Tyrosine-sulfated glycopeptide receptor 1 n=1 Tax=Morella rubra TaxID=262757 RepID=A0A6A1WQE4_9ROSI|nr:Tyrosine-sulfated glycopeptide receptor 1 [Morella rubra]
MGIMTSQETIPTNDSIAHFDGFENVQLLSLDGCHLNGQLPTWLSNLKKLEILILNRNNIMGSIPGWFSTLPRLKVDGGRVSSQYNSLLNFPLRIYLGNNSLGGKIPIEIGHLKLLRALDLSNNNFSGNIPGQMSELTNLEELDLSANRLLGEILVSLASLNFLAQFSVANNNLSGPIPSGTQLQSFSPSSI